MERFSSSYIDCVTVCDCIPVHLNRLCVAEVEPQNQGPAHYTPCM
eukprot:COSAG06_NODE_56703_length_283_cov_1.114130_1_plen_44_part_10